VYPARGALYILGRLEVGWLRPIFLFALATLGIALGPSMVSAQLLSLSWVDNSGGQAGFIVQRATSTAGPYAQIAQVPAGVVSYGDTGVTLGTTYCYQVAAVAGAQVSAFSNVACASPSGGFVLTAVDAGTGVGTVTSSPAGINCGTACSYTYKAGTVVTLTGTPSAGAMFSGWSGGGCAGTDPCSLAGNGSVTVTATFNPLPTYTLTVTKQGPGTVSSSPNGITCGSTCSASYVSGTVVTLTAVPKNGASFNGWSGGGCTGTGTCTVTLSAAVSVNASFSNSSNGKK
jgi:List-Bact-rpt repeat protein